MQRLASLRTPLASPTSVVLPEAHPCGRGYGYARADSALIRLHAHEVHLDEVVAIADVLKEPVKSVCPRIAVPFAAEPILHDDVEKSIVVIIAPRNTLAMFVRVQTCCRCDIDECPVALIPIQLL